MRTLPTAQGLAWVETALRVLETEFPYEAAHRSMEPDDISIGPRALHPAFYGSFDWHSSVHMQWSLVTLESIVGSRLFPPAALELLDQRLGVTAIRSEIGYLQTRSTFERPYGWAWAVTLAAAVRSSDSPRAAHWRRATDELADAIATLVLEWLPTQALPIRHGLHQNSAFCLSLMVDAFTELGRDDVVDVIRSTALDWYVQDRHYDTRFEPSGTDIFSPALSEAALMRRLLSTDFVEWLDGFLPGLGADQHFGLLVRPPATDGPDGAFTHLYGLALSRSAQLREIAAAFAVADDRRSRLLDAADRLERSALPTVTDGDFMSTHWLVSFALLAHRAHSA